MIVTLLDIIGRPRIFINPEMVIQIHAAADVTEATRVELAHRSISTSQSPQEVMDIINTKQSPAYEVDENGVVVGYAIARPATEADLARGEEARKRSQAAAEQAKANAIATAGFGAELDEDEGEDEAENPPEKTPAESKADDKPKPPASGLRPVSAAKTAFGKKK